MLENDSCKKKKRSMKDSVTVSIICPLYNKVKYVSETIWSVINQTYANWELIIVDDGSTDGSFELVENHFCNHKQVQLYKRSDYKENKGGSVCRNIGIQLAAGAYIMFLDADDLMAANCLEQRIKQTKNAPCNNLYVFNEAYFISNPENYFVKKIHSLIHQISYRWSKEKKRFFLKRFLKYDLPWTISNSFWESRFLKFQGGFDESLSRLQDPDFHIRMLLVADINISCLKYHLGPDVFIRINPKRHEGIFQGEVHKLNILVESASRVISNAQSLLLEYNKLHLQKYLAGYLFKIQIDLQYIQIESENLLNAADSEIKKQLEDIAQRLQLNSKSINNLWLRSHKFAISHSVLNKIKLPALIYTLFMLKGFYKTK